MADQFSRTELLFGSDSMEVLKTKRVAIFGLGGVGGYVCESLARCGITKFFLVDNDTVSVTNINRQIIATWDTVGMSKCKAMENRIKSINPNAEIETRECFYLPENADTFDFTKFDYVVDCVDTVSAKLSIVVKAKELKIPVISAMGAGNKINPANLEVADIYKTSVCPLARVMRYELKKRRINHLKVVYSKEIPLEHKAVPDEKAHEGKTIPGSTAFVPSAMGLIMASEIVKDLLNINN